MKDDQFFPVTKQFLEALIPGAVVRQEPASTLLEWQGNLVIQPAPNTIYFRVTTQDSECFSMRRDQPYKDPSKATMNERRVVEAFVLVAGRMRNGLRSWYEADLRATFPRRVIAKALCDCKDKDKEETILTAIDRLSSWAGQQYEGKPIPAAFGFVESNQSGSTSLRSFGDLSMAPVLSNGFDTILTCSLGGKILGHETLYPLPDKFPSFAPFRLGMIAKWTDKNPIALVLNRVGEILAFRNGQLRFARRSGRWHFLTHNPVIKQMARPHRADVRKALYSTCLDASFARTGGCIGVVTPPGDLKWQSVVTQKDDYLEPAVSEKAKIIKAMVNGRSFQDLPRQLRQELVAIDGATLLDRSGKILAVGAILKIAGGSTGGGRLAAAIAMSRLGLGIKISQDGQITGFHDEKSTPVFTVM